MTAHHQMKELTMKKAPIAEPMESQESAQPIYGKHMMALVIWRMSVIKAKTAPTMARILAVLRGVQAMVLEITRVTRAGNHTKKEPEKKEKSRPIEERVMAQMVKHLKPAELWLEM